MWLDGETSMGEEWEGVFLEKIPCDVWQDLRHERPVIVRKFEEKPDKVPITSYRPRSVLAKQHRIGDTRSGEICSRIT